MIDVKTFSPASLAFQSIATVAGIATIHAFVVGVGILRKKTDPNVGKTNKRQSPRDAEDSKETDQEEETTNDQYVTFCMHIVSFLQMMLLFQVNSQGF